MKTVKIAVVGFLLIFMSSCINKSVELQYAKQDIESAKYELTYFQNSEAFMNDKPMTAQYKVNIPLEISSSQNSNLVQSKITIPEMDVKIVLATGQQNLDTRNLTNINLDFSYTTDGDQKEIKSINDSQLIDFGETLGGTLDWNFLFQYVTPNLPKKQVKVGDIWDESLMLKRIEAGAKIEANLVFTHKLLGFEKIDGRECAVIKSEISSNLDDAYELMGLSWNLDGQLSGNMTRYFDYNQGITVKLKIEENSKGGVKSSGGEMSLTYKQTSVIELNLLN